MITINRSDFDQTAQAVLILDCLYNVIGHYCHGV